MHAKKVTQSRPLPLRGTIFDDWSEYDQSWAYLIMFVIASVFVPRKL